MNNEDDPLRISHAEIKRILAKSQATWSACARDAGQEALPACCVKPQNLLGKVPAFPREYAHSSETFYRFKSRIQSQDCYSIDILGTSTWAISSGNECMLDDKKMDLELLWGISGPMDVVLNDHGRFQSWPEVDECAEPQTGNNHLAILTLAWAYILSALWWEHAVSLSSLDERGTTDGLWYHDSEANSQLDPRADDFVIPLGPVSNQAARWWTAVLANGQGWSISCSRNGKAYLSPWSIRLPDNYRFKVQPSVKRETDYHPQSNNQPPSAHIALQFLADYCDFHQIYSQVNAALAVALLLPFANLRDTVWLPAPRLQEQKSSQFVTRTSKPLSSPRTWILQQERLLPYYMSISCNIRGIRALLSGVFFEPMISANAVSCWMQPAFEIIDPLLEANKFLQFVTTISMRNTTIAPLWLGATILGLESSILKPLKIGLWAVELNASAWTGTIHSFLLLRHNADHSTEDSKIEREEEARLLYITGDEEHLRVPICPWPPFGTTLLSDANIAVRKHAFCNEHRLTYKYWAWRGDEFGKDVGLGETRRFEKHWIPYCPPSSLVHKKLDSEYLSEAATKSIFSWLRVDGYPVNERRVRNHPWMLEDFSDDEEDESSASTSDSPGEHAAAASWNTLSWLNGDSV